jgi:hypothetical protein
MRSHGVPGFPSPASTGTVSLGNVNIFSAEFQKAVQDCQNLVPDGAQFQPSAAQRQAMLSSALKHARCMRAHGFTNWPDPSPDNIEVGRGGTFYISVSGSAPAELGSPRPSREQGMPSETVSEPF